MKSDIAILISGNEILDGRVLDSNSNLLCARLTGVGYQVGEIATLPDHPEQIKSALGRLSNSHAVVVISGGLGPTQDDWTREVVAEFAGAPLVRHEAIIEALRERFARRGRVMSANNEKQGYFPKGSNIIPNPKGSACGFAVEAPNGSLLIALPGIPYELEAMLEESVIGLLRSHLPAEAECERRMLRVFGLPESEVGARVEQCRIESAVTISYRVAFPEIQVTLAALVGTPELDSAYNQIFTALDQQKHVFSTNAAHPIELIVHDLLVAQNKTIAVAESCTGGMLGAMLTRTAGSSSYFLGGVQAYSNKMKERLLAVPEDLLQEHGAVSNEVAKAMAVGVQRASGSDLALSITGIAGPAGGSLEKPVGTFFIGLASESGVIAERFFYPAQREMVRVYATWCALDLLRRSLQ